MPKYRYTPVAFDHEEIQQIRDLLGTKAQATCPSCGETLLLAGPFYEADSADSTFDVMCRPCHRTATITDVPGIPSSQTAS